MANISREMTKRSAQERTKKWQPPQDLAAPEPRPGMKNRWVRRTIRNDEDVQNVVGRLRQGYEPVIASEHENYQRLEGDKHRGAVIAGDLMLMEVPEGIAQQRQEYYDGIADRLQQAVDRDLNKLSSRVMPVERTDKTDTEFGRADREVSFQEDKET